MTGAAPSLSVVIPAVAGAGPLRDCLRALASQPHAVETEIVVVSRLPEEDARLVAREFPQVKVAPGEGLTIPQMRARGIGQTRAAIVAVLGEHVRVLPTWEEAMRRGHATAAAGVGGPVTNGRRGAVAWAAFLAEYSEHMTPIEEGPVSSLPGINVSYKRSAIEACGDLLSRGAWENFLHETLLRKGLTLRCEPGAEAVVTPPASLVRCASQKWHIARSYAGMRARRLSRAARLLFAATTALLPALLTVRIVRRVLARPRRGYGGALAASFPILLLLLSIWTVGEFVGYLFGEGGSTLKVQ